MNSIHFSPPPSTHAPGDSHRKKDGETKNIFGIIQDIFDTAIKYLSELTVQIQSALYSIERCFSFSKSPPPAPLPSSSETASPPPPPSSSPSPSQPNPESKGMIDRIQSSFLKFFSSSPKNQDRFLLQEAIQKGDLEKIAPFLSTLDLNQPLPNGRRPLEFALEIGKISLLEKLMEEGANPFIENKASLSPFDQAVLAKNSEAISKFLGTKEPIPIPTIDSEDREKFEALAEFGADLFKEQEILESPIGNAIASADFTAFKRAWDETPDKNQIFTKKKLSLLHLAAIGRSHEIFEFLLNQRYDPNTPNLWWQTPFHYAALNPDSRFFNSILKKGNQSALVKKDWIEMTPLSILHSKIQSKDILNFSYGELLLLLSILFPYLPPDFFMNIGGSKPIQSALAAGALYASGFGALFKAKDQWKAYTSILFANIPLIGIPSSGWNTYQIGKYSLKRIQAGWHQIAQRPLKAILYTAARISYASYFAFHFASTSFNFYNEFKKILPLLKGHFFQEDQYDAMEDLSDIDRVNSSELNPELKKDACFMIAKIRPEDCNNRATFSKRAYMKAYRELSKKWHSDKTSAPEALSAMTRLNIAKTTLDQSLKPKS